ncbi:zinc finger protein 543-like, partial [Huso huso]
MQSVPIKEEMDDWEVVHIKEELPEPDPVLIKEEILEFEPVCIGEEETAELGTVKEEFQNEGDPVKPESPNCEALSNEGASYEDVAGRDDEEEDDDDEEDARSEP